MNTVSIIQHVDLREIQDLKRSIERYKKAQKRIPVSYKKRTLSLLGKGQTARSLAKTLQIHESTLSKWRKEYQEKLDENSFNRPLDGEGQLEKLSFEQEGIKYEAIRHEIIMENWKVQGLVLLFFGIVFLLIEFFLVQQGAYYNNAVNGLIFNEAVCLSFLTELVPVALTMALYVLNLNWFEKFLVIFVLIISFIYSTYAVSGKSINSGLEKSHQYEQILSMEKKKKDELNKITDLIDYYKSRPQTNGSIGWPMTVMKYEEQKKDIQLKLETIMLTKQKLGSVKAEITKVFFDAILKLMFQFSALVLVAQIVHLGKKVAINFSKSDWIWNL